MENYGYTTFLINQSIAQICWNPSWCLAEHQSSLIGFNTAVATIIFINPIKSCGGGGGFGRLCSKKILSDCIISWHERIEAIKKEPKTHGKSWKGEETILIRISFKEITLNYLALSMIQRAIIVLLYFYTLSNPVFLLLIIIPVKSEELLLLYTASVQLAKNIKCCQINLKYR